MYIRGNNYSAVKYKALQELKEKLNERASELDPQNMGFSPETCRRFLVGKLGIINVRRGSRQRVSLSGNGWRPKEIRNAMGAVIRETEKYLDKYKERFEQDVQDGELESVLGGQLEFDFGDSIPCGVDLRYEKMSREEIIATLRRKSEKR